MNLEDLPLAKEWLNQFELVDRQVARQLLRRLVLVSESDFESRIQRLIEGVLESTWPENVALMSVPEPIPRRFPGALTPRVPGGSSDRIKHIVENIARVHGSRVRANPTTESMRRERIRNVVLVEDLVGSGTRVTTYWKDEASRSLKSWISLGWTKLWLAAYLVMEPGRRALRRALPIDEDRIQVVLENQHGRLSLTDPMKLVAQKYGEPRFGSSWCGFGGIGSTIVFQHGCPNNAPAILWAPRNSKFLGLFPNRGIPVDLHQAFGALNLSSAAEDLWDINQYQVAIGLLQRGRDRSTTAWEARLIIGLGFASSYGRWDDQRLMSQMVLPAGEIEDLRVAAYRLELIGKVDHRLTLFGRTLLDCIRRNQSTQPSGKKASRERLPQLQDLYYPSSIGGVVRY